jgi:hypothetical protein
VSSWRIERLCRENVLFMAMSGLSGPRFGTIAKLCELGDAAAAIFTQVLLTCDRLGLIGRHMFAIKRVKLPSNADKRRSGAHAELRHGDDRVWSTRSITCSECTTTRDQTQDGSRPRDRAGADRQADASARRAIRWAGEVKAAARPALGEGAVCKETKFTPADSRSDPRPAFSTTSFALGNHPLSVPGGEATADRRIRRAAPLNSHPRTIS